MALTIDFTKNITEDFIEGFIATEGFLPTSLANLKLWLDAADTGTITIETGVSQWDDKSGQGNDVTQGTGSLQPTTNTNTINNLNVINFSGDTLGIADNASLSITNDMTVIAVLRTETTGTEQNYVSKEDGGNRSYRFRIDNVADKLWALVSDDGSSAEVVLGNSTVPLNTAFFATTVVSLGNEVSFFQNGVADGTPAITSTVIKDNDRDFTIGSKGGTENFDGDIAEVIIYDRAVTAAERQQVENYLSNKWGI